MISCNVGSKKESFRCHKQVFSGSHEIVKINVPSMQNHRFWGSRAFREGAESRFFRGPVPVDKFSRFRGHFGRLWDSIWDTCSVFFPTTFFNDFLMISGVVLGGVGCRCGTLYNDSLWQLELLVLPSDLPLIRRQPWSPLQRGRGRIYDAFGDNRPRALAHTSILWYMCVYMYIYIHIVEALYNDVLPLSMIMRASPSPNLDSILSVCLRIRALFGVILEFFIDFGRLGGPKGPQRGSRDDF